MTDLRYLDGITRMLVFAIAMTCLFAVSAAGMPQPEPGQEASPPAPCQETVIANVVALDQPIWSNRLGTNVPGGMVFALERDVCAPGGFSSSGMQICANSSPGPGNAMLKPYKRPRPIVLRVNRGQCLEVRFQSWLTPVANTNTANKGTPDDSANLEFENQPATRSASLHVQGLEWTTSPQDDGSWVGKNCNSDVGPTGQATPASCQLTGVAVVQGDGQSFCPAGDSLLTPGQARANQQAVCQQLGTWYIARLAGGGSMDGPGYGCKIRDADSRQLGNSLCAAPTVTTTATYRLFAAHEGTFVLYSTADTFSATAADGGQLTAGLFGAVHVEPTGSEYYRSQVTATDLQAATSGTTSSGQPLVNYAADYANTTSSSCYQQGTCRVGPVLSMICTPTSVSRGWCAEGELVDSDLTAIITGPNAGRFEDANQEPPVLEPSYALPDRLQPFRELTIIYHEVFSDVQAFSGLYTDGALTKSLTPGEDNFAFNYGMGGIGSEIIANRLGVGPMADCTACKYEEFFLTSWAVGDPAMVVDHPGDNRCSGTPPNYSCSGNTPATIAYYPDDPSNVYHSYLADHTKFRILHGGSDLHHLHHQHAHQWMASPNTSNGDYTDSQSIGPGSAFTLEMVYNGGGNVNQTVGDSIFHCHFYPHFAGGMWGLWRVHDVYETGTALDTAGRPKTGVNRALPDGEITAGTPIPALVPLPTLPMAPMPALVQLTPDGKQVQVCDATSSPSTCNNAVSVLAPPGSSSASFGNPGYPFFIPGVGGQRAPHPPADFAYACSDNGEFCAPAIGTTPADLSSCANPSTAQCLPLDGGLPRHVVLASGQPGCTPTSTAVNCPGVNATDFSKTLENVQAQQLTDTGTQIEQVAMAAHAQRARGSVAPDGAVCVANGYDPPPQGVRCETLNASQCASQPNCRPADFLYNGLPPVQGAPFADPCIQYSLAGGPLTPFVQRSYKAADIQFDAVFNKGGWHFPQQRILSLWGDVADTLNGLRPPEPLFFRANSGECIDYTLANLVPNVYELDDFQVRTPTDILGQHIHLVKFDVTSSDGATNGWNYEDGTFAPNEVTERIQAINQGGGITTPTGKQKLAATYLPFFGPGPGGQWMGAQATVQRWWADPLLNQTAQDPGVDRTLRTVFTHDHFGPSTHQQAGLYAGLVIEPPGSDWFCNDNTGFCNGVNGPFGGAQVGDVTVNGRPAGTPGPGRPVTGYQAPPVNDGGPTSWQAVIQPPAATCDNGICSNRVAYCTDDADCTNDGYREFLLEIQDSTLTYESFSDAVTPPSFGGYCSDNPSPYTCVGKISGSGCCDPAAATNSCGTGNVCYTFGFCSTSNSQACTLGTWTAAEDVSKCTTPSPGPPTTSQEATCNLVAGVPSATLVGSSNLNTNLAGWPTTAVSPPRNNKSPELITLFGGTNNFSFNYRNEPLFPRLLDGSGKIASGNQGDLSFVYASIDRANSGMGPYPPLTPDVGENDPFTPLLRAYAGDDVQIRTLMGAHINPHNFSIQGMSWLMEPSFVDSGWRNSLVMGISEHFEMVTKVPGFAGDYLYMPGAANIEQSGGNWGLIRAYSSSRTDLRPLPQNTPGSSAQASVCTGTEPTTAAYDVVAITAQQALAGALSYSSTPAITDPNAILYYNLNDLNCTGSSFQSCTAKSSTPQPLVLRAPAGACIKVTLYNAIDPSQITLTGATNTVQPVVASNTSTAVGLHPQLVAFDTATSSGFNVGNNPTTQTVAAGTGTCASNSRAGVNCASYEWYAGNIDPATNAHTPIEFGAANLVASDPLNHYQHGLYGALIVEPADWTWDPSATGTSELIQTASQSFWEFVLLTPDGLSNPPATPALGSDVLNAINYQSPLLNDQNTGLNTRGCTAVSCNTSQQGTCSNQTCSNNANWACSTNADCNPCSNNGTLQCSTNPSSGQPAVNNCWSGTDVSCVLSDKSYCYDSASSTVLPCPASGVPTFAACAGDQVRFRVLHPGGINTDNTFEIYGHTWSESPYTTLGTAGCTAPTTQVNLAASSVISGDLNGCPRCINGACADNPSTSCTLDSQCALTVLPVCSAGKCSNNPSRACQESAECSPSLNEWQGSRMGVGPQSHYDFVVDSAGGALRIPGDYLIRSYPAMHFRLGYWGIFRVAAPGTEGAPACATAY